MTESKFSLAYNLPIYAKDASMDVIKLRPVIFPLGHAADKHPTISKELVSGYYDNFISFWRATIGYLVKHSPIAVANPLTGEAFIEADLDSFFVWLEDNLSKEGAYSCWFELTVHKAFNGRVQLAVLN